MDIQPRNKGQKVDMEALNRGVAKYGYALKKMGYEALRPGQDKIVSNVLGLRDTLGYLPTGTGKSATFIIPTLCLDFHTLIFSPLVALMQDQVEALWRRNISAGQVSSLQSDAENLSNLSRWVSGELQFLYIAPERLKNAAMIEALRARKPDMVVVDECFPGNYLVDTEFGPRTMLDLFSSFSSGHQLPRVKSLAANGGFEFKRITHVWEREPKPMVSVSLDGAGNFSCTSNHPILTDTGWVNAGDLSPGTSRVMCSAVHENRGIRGLNSDQIQLVIGSWLGDGGIQVTSAKNRIYRIAFNHGIEQANYAKFKSALLCGDNARYIEKNGYAQTPAVATRSLCFQTPGIIPVVRRWQKKPAIPLWMSDLMDSRGLAIWAMDDGSAGFDKKGHLQSFVFHCQDFSAEAITSLRNLLGKFGLESQVGDYDSGYVLRLGKQATLRLRDLVAKYIQPELMGKFGFTHADAQPDPYVWKRSEGPVSIAVKAVVPIPDMVDLYDLEVEDTHNFVVRTKTGNSTTSYDSHIGIVAHNCHVMFQWGDNFRSSYAKIGGLIRDMAPKVVLALTATVTEEIEEAVRGMLGIQDASRISYMPERTNLKLSSANHPGVMGLSRLIEKTGGSTIVYCATVKEVDTLGHALAQIMPNKISVFHGQLGANEKRFSQEAFTTGRIPVMVATNAFGMGIDIATIRGVIHHDIPGSIISLVQEAGRAGRDGLESSCTALYRDQSYSTQRFFITNSFPDENDIRRVYAVLQRSPKNAAGEITKSVKEIAGDMGNSWGDKLVAAALQIMMRHGVVDRPRSEEKIAKVSFSTTMSDERFSKYYGAILEIGRNDGGSYSFDPDMLASRVGVGVATVTKNLRQWHDAKALTYLPPFRGVPTIITGDVDKVEFARLKAKREDAFKKLELVVKYFKIPDKDKHAYLASHLDAGEDT